MNRPAPRLLAASALLALSGAAAAQDAPAAPPAAPGPRSYLPADFARFAPRSALDMLRQVPGFAIQAPDVRRGLGQSGGNVLVNGQRISGKANDALAEVSRIPARNVIRIEIVDGASLDVPGLTGQVANVIARAGGATGQFGWQPEVRTRFTSPGLYNGSASVSGVSGPFEYTIGLRNESFRGGGGGPGIVTDPLGNVVETREELTLSSGDRPRVSATVTVDGPGSALGHLNLSYERFYLRGREFSERSGGGLADRRRTFRDRRRESGYEIGGDFEFGLGPGRLKLIGLRQADRLPLRTSVLTDFADETPATGSRFFRIGEETETIGRAEYRWRGGGADWQLSAEGAFNTLENVSSLFSLRPDGAFAEVPLPGGTADIGEDRGEATLSYGRSIGRGLSLQLSAGGEYSRLTVRGEGGGSRAFWRPKGFASVAWEASPRLSLSAKLERRVGQLNFFDFLAVARLDRDNRNEANFGLVPPQSWDLQLEARRGFGAWGTTTLKLFGRRISDIVDQIPVGTDGQAPGNLDRADVYGVDWKSTLNFAALGWRGARLDFRLLLQNSRLADPLTGEARRISNDPMRNVELTFRHDVPGSDLAWGVLAFDYRRAPVFRLDEVAEQVDSPALMGIFAEHKDVLGLTVRATLRNVLGQDVRVTRTFYDGRRTGPVEAREERVLTLGPTLAFSITGTF
jgi:outer membrane receptor for ferrienterochelin and colicins